MAEIATIARPYAEAMFKAVGGADAAGLRDQLNVLGALAANAELRQFADNPKVSAGQVFDLISAAAKAPLDPKLANLLRAMVENGRLAALPEVAAQFQALVNAPLGFVGRRDRKRLPGRRRGAGRPGGHAGKALRAQAQRQRGRQARTHRRRARGGGRRSAGYLRVKARLEQMKTALTA